MSVHVSYSNNALHFEDKPESRGHVCIPGALLHAGNLNNDCKVLWLILQHYAQQKNECWPSMDTLRTEMQCSENTIRVAMQKLATAGLVTVKHRGRGLSNVYSLPDIRNAKSEVLETQELKSRGSRNAVVDVPEPQKTAHEEVIREEVTTEEKDDVGQAEDIVGEGMFAAILKKLMIATTSDDDVALVAESIVTYPKLQHKFEAGRCRSNKRGAWHSMTSAQRAFTYAGWLQRQANPPSWASSKSATTAGDSSSRVIDLTAKDRIAPDMQARFQAKSEANLARLRAQREGGPSAAAQ